MSENIGYIALHRSLKDWQWYGVPNMVAVWVELLLSASFTDNFYDGKMIKKGQVIFGRKKFSEKLGLSEQVIRTCINRLKSTNEITIETTNKYSIVTIVKWDLYQVTGFEINQQNNQDINQRVTSQQPTSNQQVTTPNNVNNVNNVNKYNNIPSNLDSNINTSIIDLFETEMKRELLEEEKLQVISMCNFYGDKLIEYALRESVIYNHVEFPYIVKILRRWRADGMTPEKYENGET